MTPSSQGARFPRDIVVKGRLDQSRGQGGSRDKAVMQRCIPLGKRRKNILGQDHGGLAQSTHGAQGKGQGCVFKDLRRTKWRNRRRSETEMGWCRQYPIQIAGSWKEEIRVFTETTGHPDRPDRRQNVVVAVAA